MNSFFYDSPWQTLIFFLFGCFTGLLYDAFRILHLLHCRREETPPAPFLLKMAPPAFFKDKKEKKIMKRAGEFFLFIEDIVFFLLLSIGYSLLVYMTNDGELRVWGFLLFLLGFFLYRISIGKIVFSFSDTVLFLCRILIYWLFYIIMKPIRSVGGLLTCLIGRRIKAFRALIRKKERERAERKLHKELLAMAKNGF